MIYSCIFAFIFSGIVDKEIDLMDDELKIRQKSLNEVRDNTQEKLDLLREEKDVIKKAHDGEIDIIQNRLDNAREYADALAGQGLPELPDIASSWQDLNNEMEKQFEDLQKTVGASLDMGLYAEEGGVWDKMKKGFEEAKIEAKKEGKGVIVAFFDGLAASLLILGDSWGHSIMAAI